MQRVTKWGFLYHLAAALLLFSLPGLRLGTPAWHMTRPLILVFGGLAAAYLAGTVLLASWGRARAAGSLDGALIALAMFGAVTIVALTLDYQFPRAAFLAAVAIGVALLTLYPTLSRFLPPLAILCLLTSLVVLGLPAMTRVVIRPDVPASRANGFLGTSLYGMDVVRYQNVIPAGRKFTAFGSILEFEDGYLVATGDGDLFRVKLPEGKDAIVEQLPTHVPLNMAAFDKASAGSKSGQFFRIMDVRTKQRDGRLRVFASHHWWNESKRCSIVRVSLLETTPEKFASTSLDDEWKTVYESTPCLPLAATDWPFSGMEGGGRIQLLDDSTFIVTIGDHGFNGVVYSPDYVSDVHASYGKTLKVHLGSDRKVELFTIGHRNPQGLFVDATGKVWETEHGPQGGDELNLLEPGVNYGWPHVSYGTNYGRLTWPRNPQQGQHIGYALPTYAWVPSIGTSNVIRIEQDLFPAWKGDLLVSALLGGELLRLRLDGNRVVFAEPMRIGERIRDLMEDHTGQILLWTDTRSIILLRPKPAPAQPDTPPATTTPVR
jgi:glucose/arabinose dehydrogenase